MNSPYNITPEEWDIIETWLDQKDLPGESPLLSNKLTQTPNVLQKIAYVKKAREDIEDIIRQSKIREFHQSVSADNVDSGTKNISNKRIKLNPFWYFIAAALILFIGIFRLMNYRSNAEKIFAKNFKPDIGLPLKMSKSSEFRFFEGMLDYKQENYEGAIAIWQDLLMTKPDNDTLNYFLGVTNLVMGDATKSLEYLQNQERFQKGIFKEDAAWYAALANIKAGKFEEAKVFLKSNPSARNKKLLKELGK